MISNPCGLTISVSRTSLPNRLSPFAGPEFATCESVAPYHLQRRRDSRSVNVSPFRPTRYPAWTPAVCARTMTYLLAGFFFETTFFFNQKPSVNCFGDEKNIQFRRNRTTHALVCATRLRQRRLGSDGLGACSFTGDGNWMNSPLERISRPDRLENRFRCYSVF